MLLGNDYLADSQTVGGTVPVQSCESGANMPDHIRRGEANPFSGSVAQSTGLASRRFASSVCQADLSGPNSVLAFDLMFIHENVKIIEEKIYKYIVFETMPST